MPDSATVRLPKKLISPPFVASLELTERVRGEYAKREWNALMAGEILTAVSSGPDGQHASAAGVIERTPRDLWPLLVDFESRPAFLPGADAIRVVKIAGNRVWLEERVKLLFVTVAYRVINTLVPAVGSVSWMLDNTGVNDIAATTGSWEIAPVAGERHTLLRYQNVLDIGRPVPGVIEHLLLKRALPQMIGGFRTEARRRLA